MNISLLARKTAAFLTLVGGLLVLSATPADARPVHDNPDRDVCYVGFACRFAGISADGNIDR